MTAIAEAPQATTVEALAPLRHNRSFLVHEDGLEIQEPPTFNEWADMGHVLSLFQKGLAWAVGDWLNYGEQHFGERSSQAIDSRHFSEETLRVYRWVAKQVPRERRIASLSFKHHMIVASLPPPRQAAWLTRAHERSLSTSELHYSIRTEGEADLSLALWLVVRCSDKADLENLKVELESKGRVVKAKETSERTAGEPRRLTAKPKAGGKRRGSRKPKS
jgi:hypothetical protein